MNNIWQTVMQKSQDHIEVVKCISLHSDELFKAEETGVQPARK